MKRLFLFAWILLLSPLVVPSHAASAGPNAKLRIAVCERPPYSFRDGDSKWTGLGVSLWEKIAGRLGLSFEYVEVPFAQIPEKLASGECDLTPNLPLSGDKSAIRYTEPYVLSHGALLTRRECVVREMLNLTKQLVNRQMLLIIALMLVGMLLFSCFSLGF